MVCTSLAGHTPQSQLGGVAGVARETRLRDEHRLSRFLYTLLSSFPTPRQTDKYYRMTIAPMPDSTI